MLEKLQKYIQSVMEERNHTGCSAAVVKDDEVIWAKGFGYANLEEKIPATPETIYRCASVTKPVVTLGLLQWMEKGKFELDDPANDHLKVKIRTKFADQPSIRDLLTHYSGLPTHVPPIYLDKSEALTTEEWVKWVAKTVRPRHKVWAYSNPAFDIVGYMIELFSGKPYDIYMKEKVFKPLEMDSSSLGPYPVDEKRFTYGHSRDGLEGSVQSVKPYICGTIPETGCGGMLSTCTDLAHFVIAQLNGGVYKGKRAVKEKTLEEMQCLQAATGNSRSGMGLAWHRFMHHGHVVLRHTGGMPGVANHVAFYPDLKIGVVMLSNLQDGTGWRPPAPTALQIVAEEYEPFDPKKIQVETVPEEWNKFEGTYGSPGRLQKISVEDGYLVVGEGDKKIYLEKIDDGLYLIHGGSNDGYEITFEYDLEGNVKQFDLGTSVFQRYLVGSWHVVHTTNPRLYASVLEIESEEKACFIDMDGEKTQISDFKVENDRITGSFVTAPPQEYIGWSIFSGRKLTAELELLYIENELTGRLLLTREGEDGRGTGIPITLSRT